MADKLLVFLQLILIFLILLTGPVIPQNPFFAIIAGSGVVLGIWAVLAMMTKSKFSAFPTPSPKARLLSTGPYKLIRNPMYTGVIAVLLALVLTKLTFIRIMLFAMEVFILEIKVKREEKLLAKKFPEYNSYKKRTYRLIPFIF